MSVRPLSAPGHFYISRDQQLYPLTTMPMIYYITFFPGLTLSSINITTTN